MQNITIVGMSGRFALASDVSSLHQILRDGVDCIRPPASDRLRTQGMSDTSKFEAALIDGFDRFDRDLFGIGREEARYLDPEQRHLLEQSFLALEDAAWRPDDMSGFNLGVFIASALPSGFAEWLPPGKAYGLTGAMPALAAGRISHWLNSSGPAQVINTACSSSLVAVLAAVAALREGSVDAALVGAFRVHCGHYDQLPEDPLGIHARDFRSRSFDAAASGVGIGEGGGVLILKRQDEAEADGDRVRALILGGAANHDGRSPNGLTAPCQRSQTEMYRRAWRNAGIEGSDIAYFEAHGTGTQLGDPIEYRGLLQALGSAAQSATPARLGSIKSNMGHLDNAAGLAGLMKCVLSLENKVIYPTAHFSSPNPHLGYAPDKLPIATAFEPWNDGRCRLAGISSFGLSGTNAHLVLSEADDVECKDDGQFPHQVVHLSGRTADHLAKQVQAFKSYISTVPANALRDVVWSQNVGRTRWPYRFVVSGRKAADLASEIDRNIAAGTTTTSETAGILLLGSGQIVRSDLHTWLRPDDVSFLAPELAGIDLEHSLLAQQVLAFRLWSSLGIEFRAMIATGQGTIAKRVITGELLLDEGLRLERETAEAAPLDQGRLSAAVAAIMQEGAAIFLSAHASDPLATEVQSLAPTAYVDHILGPQGWAAFNRHVGSGLKVDGGATIRTGRRRVSIPTTELQRETLWPDSPISEVGSSPISTARFSAPMWFPFIASETRNPGTTLYMRLGKCSAGLEWNRIKAALPEAVLISFGSAFADTAEGHYLDFSNSAHLDQLLSKFAPVLRTVIIEYPDGLDTGFDLSQGLQTASVTAAISSALCRLKHSGDIRLMLVSSGGSGPEGYAIDPSASLCRGFAKVGADETPGLRVVHFDLGADEDKVAAVIGIARSQIDERHMVLALRRGRTWRSGFIEIQPEPCNSLELSDAVVLITGGTGGIGLALATDLLGRGNARVALLSRNAECAGGPISVLGGPRLKLFSADVREAAALQQVKREIEAEWGAVNLVIHAAGLPGGGLLRNRAYAETSDVLDVKVQGAVNLCQVFQGPAIKNIVFMSSLSSQAPAVGQADYCAANIFLDEYAATCRAAGKPVVSIAWTRWREVGMAAHAPKGSGFGAPVGLTVEAAVEACWQALACPFANVAVSEVPIAELRSYIAESIDLGSSTLLAQDRDGLAKELLAKAAELLGLEMFAEEDDLFDLGASSLDLIDLFEFVDERFPDRLSVQALLDDPSISAVLDALCGRDVSEDVIPSTIVLELE